MDREQYDIMYQVESVHWWYRGMRYQNREILRQHLAPGLSHDILDAGCGTGGSTQDLARFGRVTGVDFSWDALDYASSRGLPRLVRASIEALPFPDRSFDVVTSFDVIYHRGVVDERRALAEFHRVLRPGGLALVRSPAFNWLRGTHDIGIHTERRFTTGQLAGYMRDVGFEVVNATYTNAILFPLALAKRTVEHFLRGSPAPSDLSVPPAPVNRVMERVLTLETPAARTVGLPIGLSVVVLGRA
jgi:ubiquinone/menaquinone biosynthesis C-methylase UbiE